MINLHFQIHFCRYFAGLPVQHVMWFPSWERRAIHQPITTAGMREDVASTNNKYSANTNSWWFGAKQCLMWSLTSRSVSSKRVRNNFMTSYIPFIRRCSPHSSKPSRLNSLSSKCSLQTYPSRNRSPWLWNHCHVGRIQPRFHICCNAVKFASEQKAKISKTFNIWFKLQKHVKH